MESISTKAGLLAGSIAVALVAAGTTGAVASQLIGSQDIAKNAIHTRHLDKGSVKWGKTFSAKTKAKITALAGQDGVDGTDGTDGADGADGAPGPQGPRGVPGQPGSDGNGSLYDTGTFGGGWVQNPDTSGFFEVAPQGGPLVLEGPGSFLVNGQAVLTGSSFGGGFPPFAYIGDVDGFFGEDNSFLEGTDSCFALLAPNCATTSVVHLQDGESMNIGMIGYTDSGCTDTADASTCPPSPAAFVTVYKMTDDGADTSTFDSLVDDLYPPFNNNSNLRQAQKWQNNLKSLLK